jgi:two-component system, sensor histidine kinase
MVKARQNSFDDRVLVVAPFGYDAKVIADVLARENVTALLCADLVQVCHEAQRGAAALVIAEEAILADRRILSELLSHQPAWSDIPIILLVSSTTMNPNGKLTGEKLSSDGNITLLERPLHINTFLSTIRVALRSRERQYQVRDLLQQREADLRQREQDLRARDEFLAMLAHELRNPLAPIRNALQVLKLVGPNDKRTERPREIIERQITHMVRIIDDLMDVSRVERGKVQLCYEPVELSHAVSRAVESCRASIQARGHELHLSLDTEPIWIDADPTRFEQMISNILNNAAKYTAPGGRIWVSIRREEGHGFVDVRDNGRGIAGDMLEKVFDIFTQVRSSLDRNEGGLGIGLSLVKKLAQLHGGTISASSPGLGKGSTFTLMLPLRTEAPSLAEDEKTNLLGDARRILVVEDNDDSRESLQMMLSLFGHSVDVAPDGETGLRMLLQQEPDLALIDVGLPGLDGYALVQAALSAKPTLKTRLIALTGYGQPEDQRRALQSGFANHLTKPVAPDNLASIISGCEMQSDERAA